MTQPPNVIPPKGNPTVNGQVDALQNLYDALDTLLKSPIFKETMGKFKRELTELKNRLTVLLREVGKLLEKLKSLIDQRKIKEAEKELEEANKKFSGGLKGLLKKIIAAVALVLAVAAVIVCPTPFAVASLVVTLALFIDFVVADATGKESLMDKTMQEITNKLVEELGPEAGGALAAIIGVAIVLVLCLGGAGAAKGVGALIKMLPKLKALVGLTDGAATGASTTSKVVNVAPETAAPAGSTGKQIAQQVVKFLKDLLDTVRKAEGGMLIKLCIFIQILLGAIEGAISIQEGRIIIDRAKLLAALDEFKAQTEYMDADVKRFIDEFRHIAETLKSTDKFIVI